MLEFARILRAIEKRQRHPGSVSHESAAAAEVGLAIPQGDWPEMPTGAGAPEDETAGLIASLREDGEEAGIESAWESEFAEGGDTDSTSGIDAVGSENHVGMESSGAEDANDDNVLEPASSEQDGVMALPGVELDSADDILEDVVAAESASGSSDDDGVNAAGLDGESLEAMIAELKADIDGEDGSPDAALSPEEDACDTELTAIDAEYSAPTHASELQALFDADSGMSATENDGNGLSEDKNGVILSSTDTASAGELAASEAEEVAEGSAAVAHDDRIEEAAADDPVLGGGGPVETDDDALVSIGEGLVEADTIAEPLSEPGAGADTVALDVEEAARILDIDGTEEALAVGSGEVEDEALMRQVQDEAKRLAENLDDAEDDETDIEPGESGHIEAGEAAVRQAPVLTPFRAALGRLIDALNYPLDLFRLSESTRNAIGYTALMVLLVVVVIVIVILAFYQFTLVV